MQQRQGNEYEQELVKMCLVLCKIALLFSRAYSYIVDNMYVQFPENLVCLCLGITLGNIGIDNIINDHFKCLHL